MKDKDKSHRSLDASGAALILMSGLAVASMPSAHASPVVFTGRTTTQTLSFADTSGFSDAGVATTTHLGVSGALGDTVTLNYLIPAGATGFSVGSLSPDFAVTAPVYTANSPNGTQTFTISGNAPSGAVGTIQLHESLSVGAAPSGALNTLSTGTLGGVNYLDETYNPVANQTVGHPFTYTVILPGDYSASGTAAGDHELISLGAAWSIGQSWVFNGSTTTFSVTIPDYQGVGVTPLNLEYQIYGATPVPLPAGSWLMVSGLGLLAAVVRRKSEELRKS
jgi:hypothetical protein